MKLNRYYWELFIHSELGTALCELFSPNIRSIEGDIEIFDSLNSGWKVKKELKTALTAVMEDIWVYGIEEFDEAEINSLEDAENLYKDILALPFIQGLTVDILVPIISLPLNYKYGEYFMPYLFTNRFSELKKIADFFDIDIPNPPKKSDYNGRFMYYWELCKVFYEFRIENELTPQELAAFLYGHGPKSISEDITTAIPEPSQAWFIGGVIRDRKHYTKGYWQANPEVKKGDILIHYETHPISAITCMWRAHTDGVIDPFVHYYSNCLIKDKIELPHITLDELKSDDYFKNHPLTRKNFQGVGGWHVTSEDYSELLRILKNKGVQIETLPTLFSPHISTNLNITLERDVETSLLEPLLNSLGYKEGRDFIRQLPIKAGRGHRVFLDYALHYDDTKDYEKAQVLIEAKLHMRTNREIDEAFSQALSYARPLEAQKIILCDKECLILYEKTQGFDRNKYRRIYWSELTNADKYNQFKNTLAKR